MSKLTSIAAAAAIALGAGPVLAAPSPATPPANQPAPAATANPPPSHSGTATVAGTNGNSSTSPSQRNPLLADNGDVRMSKLIGTDIYNKQDKKLGSVDDVLMGSNGQPDVVVSTNNKLVEVPWNKLTFGNAKENGDNKVIMEDETQQSMNQMPQFKYKAND